MKAALPELHRAGDKRLHLLRFQRRGQALAMQQFGHRDAERRGQRLQQADVGQAQRPFPFADGFIADANARGELFLRPSFFFAQGSHELAKALLVDRHALPLPWAFCLLSA